MTSKENTKKNAGCGTFIGLLLIVGACTAIFDNDDKPTTTQTTTTAAAPTTPTTAPNVAPGIDPKLAPQEWFDEAVYRHNHCVSQNLAYGGIAICSIRKVDTNDDGTMLIGYIDQDEEGVQDFFTQQQRRDNMVDGLAGRVAGAKVDGDPRVQHVTAVRIIATGGKGFGSGWQGETTLG